MKYEQPKSNEWVQPTPKGYKMMCCDCGLVHELDFRVIKYASGKRTKVQFRVRRNDIETKKQRHSLKKIRFIN